MTNFIPFKIKHNKYSERANEKKKNEKNQTHFEGDFTEN